MGLLAVAQVDCRRVQRVLPRRPLVLAALARRALRVRRPLPIDRLAQATCPPCMADTHNRRRSAKSQLDLAQLVVTAHLAPPHLLWILLSSIWP